MAATATDRDRVKGALFGLAFGDALGLPTEFLNLEAILRRWPPAGPQDLAGKPILVSDDTQMTLAVGEALLAARESGGLTPQSAEPALRQSFIDWMRSPDNYRAPGITCMSACQNLAAGEPWHEATAARSKGCGANMRVAPVAFVRDLSSTHRAALAQFQAALTHGHPTALAASDLTVQAIVDLASSGEPGLLLSRLTEYARSQRRVFHQDWLGPLWRRLHFPSPEEYIAYGWDECLAILDRIDRAMQKPDRLSDPCEATGQGKVAEEAFATGLLCFLLFKDDPVGAIRRAAATSGDSDSIACLAGAFAGARWGMSHWPASWVEDIEYRERLELIATRL